MPSRKTPKSPATTAISTSQPSNSTASPRTVRATAPKPKRLSKLVDRTNDPGTPDAFQFLGMEGASDSDEPEAEGVGSSMYYHPGEEGDEEDSEYLAKLTPYRIARIGLKQEAEALAARDGISIEEAMVAALDKRGLPTAKALAALRRRRRDKEASLSRERGGSPVNLTDRLDSDSEDKGE